MPLLTEPLTLRGLVSSELACLDHVVAVSRLRSSAPLGSYATTSLAPALSSNFVVATAPAPGSRDYNADLGQVLLDDFQRVQRPATATTAVPCWSSWKTGMPRSLEPLFDVEAARGRDVFQVDAAEARGEVLHRLHDFIGVLGVEADRPRVNSPKP